MFWGLILKANKKYTQTIKQGFHLSQAALDTSNSTDEPVQVVLTTDNHNYILCTLRKNKVEQIPLDLNFAEGDEISFTSQGNGSVHLSGYFIPNDDDLNLLSDEDESEDESQEIAEQSKKIKPDKEIPISNALKKIGKKQQQQKKDEDDDDDSNESDEDDEDEDDDDDDDDEEEEDDESSGDEEEEVIEPSRKKSKLDSSTPQVQNGLENGKAQKEKQKEKKKDKNLQNKQQQQQDKTPKGGEKNLPGGVKIEDIRVGNGPEAKPGKKVQVYYEGRLKSNNKVFDSSKQGAGFKFGLGRNEVIKGWDIGVAGMKVGGKRRIICPPNVAYGAKGSPPVIPPNSTLVFEVELKSVN